jgi:hypothetical protein
MALKETSDRFAVRALSEHGSVRNEGICAGHPSQHARSGCIERETGIRQQNVAVWTQRLHPP